MKKEKVEILVIEDDQPQAELIKEMLGNVPRQRYAVTHLHYLTLGLEALKEQVFDCVMVDLGLPDSQGLETALSVRRQAREVPIVVLTVLDDEEAAMNALKMDIQDYLIKGEINTALLTRSIRYAIQRKAVARELSQSEERLRVASQAADISMWHWDLLTREVVLDLRGKRFFGIETDASPCLEQIMASIDPQDREKVAQALGRALQDKSEYAVEFRVQQADGSMIWLMSKGRAFYDDQGTALRMDGITMDITARKEAESRIEQLNAELAERAAELEAANRELESFNYTVAHDLRQPLNLLYGYCQGIDMLCGSELGEDCRRYLADAYQAIRRMTRLLDSLLEFSRMSRRELRRARVDLSALARGIANDLRKSAPDRAVTFAISEGIEVDADPGLMEVVLQNLIGNAWKYTQKQEQATIEVGHARVEGKRACYVRDNGPGFDQGQADKLFLPFQRLPGSDGSQGFGIGLATVERIVNRHGGRVWAEGVPGKGATFYFTLDPFP